MGREEGDMGGERGKEEINVGRGCGGVCAQSLHKSTILLSTSDFEERMRVIKI